MITGRWFSGTLIDKAEFGYYETQGEISIEAIQSITERTVNRIGARYPIVVFPDKMCGWKHITRNKRFAPVLVSSVDELNSIMECHLYFCCKGGMENYDITDSEMKWFIIIDHEGCWSFSAPWNIAHRLVRSWNKLVCNKKAPALFQPSRITSTPEFKRLLAGHSGRIV
jgi:hypothetical protein